MRIIALVVFLIVSSQAHAQFIGVKTKDQRYYFKQVHDRFTYKDGKIDRAFKIKKCNKKFFAQFWKDVEKKFKNRKPIPDDAKPTDTIRINYQKNFYKIWANSDLGIILQSPQTILQNIMFEENVYCNKKEDLSRK